MSQQISESITSQPLLLVGCGGIGCEVIKNLLLVGFNNIKMIDLDTIDVSNLNRQFLFNKTHINQSKAIVSGQVASELFVNKCKENLKLVPIHGSILIPEYDVEFFKQFSVVINALDNRQARSHVNRMCLAADVPLIESGTEGYLGQTFMIKKNVTACYECSGPKADQKTFASCTIRNTPSLPIHCIVWAKHLFNQLFGEDEDPDNDVSPDMNDPELLNSSNDKENNGVRSNNENDDSTSVSPSNTISTTDNVQAQQTQVNRPPSTRQWAKNNDYDSILLFDKLFRLDIEYLHKMDKLWENRKKPIALQHDQLDIELPNTSSAANNEQNSSSQQCSLADQKMLNLKECYEMFANSLEQLKERLKDDKSLVWDKDDEAALDFVTAVSNLRSFCFHIERKSKFDVKSMAGNIIPAISSTNSIIGGLMVLQLINLLKRLSKLTEEQRLDKGTISELFKSTIKHVFLRKVSINVDNLISSYECFEQNPQCLVCNTKNVPEIELRLNLKQVTLCEFIEQFVFKKLNFVCPDVQIDGKPTIIWSKDDCEDFSDQEKEDYKTKFLIDYAQIKDKIRLRIYDLLQNLTVIITLINDTFNLNENDGLFYKMKITSEPDSTDKQMDDEISDEVLTTVKVTNDSNSSIEDSQIETINTSSDQSIVNCKMQRQDAIDLEHDVVVPKSTNGKVNGGLTNNDHTSKPPQEDIVLLDSDDEDDSSNRQHSIIKQKTSRIDHEVLQVIDDDDDLEFIEMKELQEKRKLDSPDCAQTLSKKQRLDDVNNS